MKSHEWPLCTYLMGHYAYISSMEIIETLHDCSCLGVALHKLNVVCIPLSVIAMPEIHNIVLTIP